MICSSVPSCTNFITYVLLGQRSVNYFTGNWATYKYSYILTYHLLRCTMLYFVNFYSKYNVINRDDNKGIDLLPVCHL